MSLGNVILNLVWFSTIGWFLAFLMIIVGGLLFCTIIGIPLGVICFRKSLAIAFPFGRPKPETSPIPTIHITNVQNNRED